MNVCAQGLITALDVHNKPPADAKWKKEKKNAIFISHQEQTVHTWRLCQPVYRMWSA